MGLLKLKKKKKIIKTIKLIPSLCLYLLDEIMDKYNNERFWEFMNKFSIAFIVYNKIYILPSLSLSCVYEDMKIFNNHLF